MLPPVSVCVTGHVCLRHQPGLSVSPFVLSVPPAMSVHVTGCVSLCHLLCLGHLGHADLHMLARLICSACNDRQGQPAANVHVH
jgi:hypothetical protein